MNVCPHCRHQIPEQPSSGGGAGPILLWGGLGMLTGMLMTCVVGFLATMVISTIGTRAETTFTTVGNSLSSGS